jgi:hypothetical protein
MAERMSVDCGTKGVSTRLSSKANCLSFRSGSAAYPVGVGRRLDTAQILLRFTFDEQYNYHWK